MTAGNGLELSNPYLHMSRNQLLRRHKQIERNIRKIMAGRGKNLDFELNRVAFLTISEALKDKYQAEELQKLFELDQDDSQGPTSGGNEV